MGSADIKTVAVACLSALMAWIATATSPVRSFEYFLSDVRTSAHNDAALLSEDIVILALDDQALEDFPYTSPINRNFLAEVVAKLDKSGASVIGLDFVLDRATEPAADAALETTIAGAQAGIVLVSDPGSDMRDQLCQARPTAAPRGPVSTTILDAYADTAVLGHGVICIDRLDEVHRQTAGPNPDVPSFAEALWQATVQGAADAAAPQASWPVPFALTETGKWPFPTYSAALLDQLPEDWLGGKTVLVGAIAPYSGDWEKTPLRFADVRHTIAPTDLMPEGQLPGVVIHAYALQAMLDRAAGDDGPAWLPLLLIALGVLVGMGLGLSRLSLWRVTAALAGAVVAYWLVVFLGHRVTGLMAPFTGFSAGLLIAAGACFALLERSERAQRRLIHSSFAHFLAPQVVDLLARSPERLTLETEDSEVTALFTDLAGFTHFVDTTPPADVAGVLNGYLDVIVEAVVDHGGVVDKIVGDAVHALFSAPLKDPHHRENAIRCALDIETRTEAYRAVCKARGISLGETRIGVNSGRALVGNFGSSKRFDYTAHGSTINIAARLEAANKTFGTRICVSAHSKVPLDDVVYREIGNIEVRGVGEPLRVYEARSPNTLPAASVEAYTAAMAQAETDPEAALAQFQALAADAPDDGLLAHQIRKLQPE